MDQSVVHSAKQGSFVPIFKGQDLSRYVDITAVDRTMSDANFNPMASREQLPLKAGGADRYASKSPTARNLYKASPTSAAGKNYQPLLAGLGPSHEDVQNPLRASGKSTGSSVKISQA